MSLKNTIAIIGAAETDEIGRIPHKSALQLHAEGARNALADAGIDKSEVDGLLTAGVRPSQVAEYLGIVPSYVDGTSVGGCSFLIHVQHAAAAIAAGLCRVALVTHGQSGRSRVGEAGRGDGPQSPAGQFEIPYGVFGAVTTFSLPAVRHMMEYGTTQEMFSAVSVATRRWASLNPRAMMRDPITIADVLNSRLICWPFHLLHCCLVADGGGALVITSADRARSMGLRKKPVYLLGSGEAVAHAMVSQMRDFTTSDATRIAAQQAFRMAGVSPKDIDHVMFYDAFAHNPIFALEDCGFVNKGEGGPFMLEMRTAPGGDFPMNTNGGGLSYVHTGMYGMFAIQEAVRQLRGECGERQVKNCRLSLVQGPGGMFSAGAVLILSNEMG